MGLFDSAQRNELNQAILDLKTEIANLTAEREAQTKATDLNASLIDLQQELENLKISKARLIEDNEREKREVTHMVGLERKRQEFEADQARKGIETAREKAVLEVREENLKTERDAFTKQMAFQQTRFETEVKYLRDLMGQILDRLPTVTVDRQITEKTTKSA